MKITRDIFICLKVWKESKRWNIRKDDDLLNLPLYLADRIQIYMV